MTSLKGVALPAGSWLVCEVQVRDAGLSEDPRAKETQSHEDKKRDHGFSFLVQTRTTPWCLDGVVDVV
jgi:hypothetical protein